MKQIKPIFFSALITIIAFGAVTYMSCTKNACSGVSCQNGGTCNGGTCSCPTGYTGATCAVLVDPCAGVTCYNGGTCNGGTCTCPTGYSGPNCATVATTTVTYTNDTYTPVSINQAGNMYTIPVGGSFTFSGTYGTTVTATATTSGTYGTVINWNLSNVFPASGNSAVYLDVSPSYFFLEIRNTNPSNTVTTLDVNFNIGGSSQSIESVSIANNGVLYGIGYYQAFSNTEIKLAGNLGTIESNTSPIALPFTSNQAYTFYYN